jgi:5-methyltetrahydrofolate--homocysteine methyltransferase
MGVALHGVVALGRLVRDEPQVITALHTSDVEAGADVLLALTSDTMAVALGHIGMAFRAAALTRCAVDLALDAARRASRPIAVAGVIGNPSVEVAAADRAEEECSLHAARLVSSGCDLILARGLAAAAGAEADLSRLARRAAIKSAAATRLPTWALIELEREERAATGESIEELALEAMDAGAELVLLEVPSVDVGLGAIGRIEAARPGTTAGVIFAAQGDDAAAIEAWVKGGRALADAGARVLGGGAGARADHVAALASALAKGARPG